jgi:REP element-mobilizing transposase RayT
MGRALRTIDPDAVCHAGSRGSNRGLLAFDTADFESLSGELAKAADRYGWRVLAWCVMPNHTHLVLSTPRGGFSDGFREMNGNHSRRTNRRHEREAHLFKNRPWAVELMTPAHLIGAIAYVLRNPVTAELCATADEWPYSSYRASVGLAVPPRWLALHDLHALFGTDIAEARRRLDALVHEGHLAVELPVSDTN